MGVFLKHRTYNTETKKFHFTHKRLRSAYRSLVSNLPYQFTHQKYHELRMPNTSNYIEGMFSKIKMNLRVHNGMKIEKKKKVINYLLSKYHPLFVHYSDIYYLIVLDEITYLTKIEELLNVLKNKPVRLA